MCNEIYKNCEETVSIQTWVGDEVGEPLAFAFARDHGLKGQTVKNIIKKIVA